MNKKSQSRTITSSSLFNSEEELLSWLDSHKGRQVRIPVCMPQGSQDVFLGFQGHHAILINDLRMGIPFSMHVRAIQQPHTNLFLWLDGYWDVKGILPLLDAHTKTKTFELHHFVGIIPHEKRDLMAFLVHCL